jgi:hypothetical protein
MMSAVVITTVAIVPILWPVPEKLTATADGEENTTRRPFHWA